MPSIQLSDLTFSHRDDSPIFTDVDLNIGSGWTGVVGANGAGKTTLLLLVAGDLQPDRGAIDRPDDLVACSQVVEHLDQGIRDLAGDWSAEAYTLRGRLALDPDQGGPGQGLTVPRSSLLRSAPVEGVRCTFRTCYPVTLWPLAVESVDVDSVTGSAPEESGARSLLRIRLRAQGATPLSERLMSTSFS